VPRAAPERFFYRAHMHHIGNGWLAGCEVSSLRAAWPTSLQHEIYLVANKHSQEWQSDDVW
jgi:hypothetical protein